MPVLDLLELSGDQCDQVVGVRFFLGPMKGYQSRSRVPLFRDEYSIGNNGHPLRHVAGHLCGQFFVWRIKARIPVAGIDRFALAEEVGFTRLIAHFWCAEVQALGRFTRIGNGHSGLAIGGNRRRKGHHHLAIGRLPSPDGFCGGDRLNRQFHGVELQFGDGLLVGLEAECGPPHDGPGLKIRGDIECQMPDADLAVRGVTPVQRGIGRREKRGGFDALRIPLVTGFESGSHPEQRGGQQERQNEVAKLILQRRYL